MVIDMNEIKGEIPDMKLKGFYTVCETPDYKVGTTVRDIDSAGNPPPDYRELTVNPDAPDFSFSGSPYHIENAWQKCPICEGSGKRFMYSDTGENHFVSDYNDCETCKGKRIISTITGKPPSDE